MSGRYGSLGVIALFCVLCLGPMVSAGVAGAADQPGVRIFDVTAAHGIIDKRPDRPTRIFAPNDNPIYVWFRAEGCTIGTTITSVWYYLDVDPPIRIREGSVTVEVLDDW